MVQWNICSKTSFEYCWDEMLVRLFYEIRIDFDKNQILIPLHAGLKNLVAILGSTLCSKTNTIKKLTSLRLILSHAERLVVVHKPLQDSMVWSTNTCFEMDISPYSMLVQKLTSSTYPISCRAH